VSVLQTAFLAGNVWGVIVPNAAVLAVMAVVVLFLSRVITRKQLD
jgi:ABC-2 type transport system permease protein